MAHVPKLFQSKSVTSPQNFFAPSARQRRALRAPEAKPLGWIPLRNKGGGIAGKIIYNNTYIYISGQIIIIH